MRLWRWLLLSTLTALALLLPGNDEAAPIASAGADPLSGGFAPGELLVKARPSAARAATVAGAVEGARPLQHMPEIDVFRIGLPPGTDVAEAVETYERLPWVEFAEPNYYVRADIVPNDPCYASGFPCPSTQQWYYDLIQAPGAWDITTGSLGVVVAVVDSGVDLNHPDLDGNLVAGATFISGSGCAGPKTGDPPQDDFGHGTKVAGIVGAKTNNGVGVAGTAWSVRIMPVKALDCTGVGLTSDIVDGIGYAAAQGADIVNMSFGSCVRDPCKTGPCQPPPLNGSLWTAIQQAQATYGTVFVGAAGNEACPYVAYPAAFPEVIAVGASASPPNQDQRASFSNWGPEIDIAAPGQLICSTNWDNTYACGDGTSFAAPLGSGLAALVLSEHPGFSPQDVLAVLQASAVNLADGSTPGWDGCGRIDMREALLLGQPPVFDDVLGVYDYGGGLMAMWRFASNGTDFCEVRLSYVGCAGCWDLSRAQMLAADVNGDGIEDVVGVYDYGGGLIGMWNFISDGTNFSSVRRSLTGCSGCWQLDRSQMVAADVNGDGRDDIVGIYDYGGGLMGMWNFISDGTDFSSVRRSLTGCGGCWQLDRSQMVAADVNGDLKDDIVGIYDYGGGLMGMWNFVSDGTDFSGVRKSLTGCSGCWQLDRSQMVAADVNGDLKDDIVGIYDYGGGMMGMWNFISDGTNFSSIYRSYTGCAGCWELARSRMLPLNSP